MHSRVVIRPLRHLCGSEYIFEFSFKWQILVQKELAVLFEQRYSLLSLLDNFGKRRKIDMDARPCLQAHLASFPVVANLPQRAFYRRASTVRCAAPRSCHCEG